MTDRGHGMVIALALACSGSASCVGGGAPADPFALPSEARGREPSQEAKVSEEQSPPAAAGSKGSHFPLLAGARWTYHHAGTEQGEWDEVASLESVTYDGRPAFVLHGQQDARGEQTRSTLLVVGSGVFRVHKEEAVGAQPALITDYDPGFLRYDEAWRTEGQTQTLTDGWTQMCIVESAAQHCAPGAVRVSSTTHIFRVKQLSTRITVPAGTFDTVEIERENPGDLQDPGEREIKQFWFAAGVGKVRELNPGTGATEELTELSLP